MLKKFLNLFSLKYTLIGTIVGLFFFGGFLLWSTDTSLIGFIDALTVSALMVFTIGWFLFFSNQGALSSLFYGMKTFFMGIAGKRPKKSYYEEMSEREKVQKNVYWGFWFASIIYLVPLLTLYIIYFTK